jgi:hypothetical protein
MKSISRVRALAMSRNASWLRRACASRKATQRDYLRTLRLRANRTTAARMAPATAGPVHCPRFVMLDQLVKSLLRRQLCR